MAVRPDRVATMENGGTGGEVDAVFDPRGHDNGGRGW